MLLLELLEELDWLDEWLDQLELEALEADELLKLDVLTDERELTLDREETELDELCELALEELTLDELDELAELLDELSSIDKMQRRSPVLGPGNCNEPVWKISSSAGLTAPDVDVSTRTACHIVLSGRATVTEVTAPASAECVDAIGKVSPAHGMRVIVSTRVLRPAELPSPNKTFFISGTRWIKVLAASDG